MKETKTSYKETSNEYRGLTWKWALTSYCLGQYRNSLLKEMIQKWTTYRPCKRILQFIWLVSNKIFSYNKQDLLLCLYQICCCLLTHFKQGLGEMKRNQSWSIQLLSLNYLCLLLSPCFKKWSGTKMMQRWTQSQEYSEMESAHGCLVLEQQIVFIVFNWKEGFLRKQ